MTPEPVSLTRKERAGLAFLAAIFSGPLGLLMFPVVYFRPDPFLDELADYFGIDGDEYQTTLAEFSGGDAA